MEQEKRKLSEIAFCLPVQARESDQSPGRKIWLCGACCHPVLRQIRCRAQGMLQSMKVWRRAGETLTDLCWQMGIEGFISHAVVSCFAVSHDEMRKNSRLLIAAEGF